MGLGSRLGRLSSLAPRSGHGLTSERELQDLGRVENKSPKIRVILPSPHQHTVRALEEAIIGFLLTIEIATASFNP